MKSAELSAALARARLDIDDELRESRQIGAALRTSGLLDGEPAALDRRTRRVLKAQEALLDRMAFLFRFLQTLLAASRPQHPAQSIEGRH